MAHDEASQMHQALIGTEHLLFGLVRLGEGLGTQILRKLDVDLEELHEYLRRTSEAGDQLEPNNQIAFTPEAQRALQLAYGRARQRGDHHIGTEHILMALATEGRGKAYHALRKQDVNAARIRAALMEMRPADAPEGPTEDTLPREGEGSRAEQVALAARELLRRAHEAAADMRRHLEQAEDLLEEIAELVEEDQQQTGSAAMDKETLASERIPPAVGPYSQAVRAGEMIFCSGVIALDPETKELVQDSFEAEVVRVMENLSLLLQDCGTGLDRVVKTTVFLADIDQFSEFNDIYAQYFEDEPPARSTVQAAALPLGAQIEVEAIAIA
jgi:2-iminobutanoate/2-iminopropanoate deaminase